MCLQGVEEVLTGLAHIALPGLPYPGGDMGYPQPLRVPPRPSETSAAGAVVFPLIKFRHLSPSRFLIEAPGVRGNSVCALVQPQVPEPASSQDRYEGSGC